MCLSLIDVRYDGIWSTSSSIRIRTTKMSDCAVCGMSYDDADHSECEELPEEEKKRHKEVNQVCAILGSFSEVNSWNFVSNENSGKTLEIVFKHKQRNSELEQRIRQSLSLWSSDSTNSICFFESNQHSYSSFQ